MSIILLVTLAAAGVNSLLMPATPIGLTNGFSMARNEEAIFYNPANFQASEDFRLACFYNRLYLSMQSFALCFSKQVHDFDLGLAIFNFDYGEIEGRPDYPTEDDFLDYTANDFTFILGGRKKISSQGSIGLNLKYINENIYIYSDHALAFDLSFSYIGTRGGISFGTQNFGSRLTLNNEDVSLPARLSFGGFYGFGQIKVSTDFHYLINNSVMEMGFGLSLPLYRIIELNCALNYRDSFYPGLGLTLNTGKISIKYGAALYPKDLGLVNILGLGFSF